MSFLQKIVKPKFLIVLLLTFHLLGNLTWSFLNNAPPTWDAAAHSTRAVYFTNFFHSLFSGNPNTTLFESTFSDAYAPLTTLFMGVVMFIFGVSIKLAQSLGTIFFLPAIYVAYLLGKEVTKNEWVGFWSAFMFSFFQIVYDNSRWFLLDVPLTFFVTLNLYFLFKSNFFTSNKYALLSGVTVFTVALTKIQGLYYLFVPFLVVIVFAIYKKQYKGLSRFVLGLLISGLLTLPWLVAASENLKRYFSYASAGEPLADPTNLLDLTTWVFYLKLFVNNCMPLALTLPILVLPLFAKPKLKNGLVILALSALFVYVSFTFFKNKDLRFIFPMFPWLAILFSQFLDSFRLVYGKAGTVVSLYLVLVSIFLYINLSFGIPLKKGHTFFVRPPFFNDLNIIGLAEYPVAEFSKRVWPYERLINDLELRSKSEGVVRMVFLPNYDRFNENTFILYYTIYGEKEVDITRFGGRSEFENTQGIIDTLALPNFILYTKENPSVFYATDMKASLQMQQYVSEMLLAGQYRKLSNYHLPTKQEILLLERLSLEPLCTIDYVQDFNSVTFSVSWQNNEVGKQINFNFGDGGEPLVLTGVEGSTDISHDYPYNEGEIAAYEAGFSVVSGQKVTTCRQKLEIIDN